MEINYTKKQIDAMAQQFAKDNGISIEKAKSELLEAYYATPQPNSAAKTKASKKSTPTDKNQPNAGTMTKEQRAKRVKESKQAYKADTARKNRAKVVGEGEKRVAKYIKNDIVIINDRVDKLDAKLNAIIGQSQPSYKGNKLNTADTSNNKPTKKQGVFRIHGRFKDKKNADLRKKSIEKEDINRVVTVSEKGGYFIVTSR